MSHFYKNIKQTELKVGIFVLFSFLILFFSYSWLNDWFLGSSNETIQVLFENVNNLEKGNTVYFRGVRIGKVNALNITNDGIVVDLLISKGLFIDKNALFIIKDKDMMGTKMLEIYPGDSRDMINSNELQSGISLPGLSDLISNLGELIDSFENIISQIDFTDDFIERIDRIITVTENSLSGLEHLIININNSDLFTMFTELKNTSGNIDLLVNETSKNLTITFSRLDSLLVNTTDFISVLQENIDREDSNLHRLMNDLQLYENLVNSSKELEILINDIKENPRRYFKFSIF